MYSSAQKVGSAGEKIGREDFGLKLPNWGGGGRIAHWIAFSLSNQVPRVPFLAFPRTFLDVAKVNPQYCCIEQWRAEA